MKLKAVLLSLGLAAQVTSTAAGNATSDTVIIHIDATRTLYKGLPFFVAITVRNEQSEPITLPRWNPLEVHLPLTVHFRSASGRDYSSTVDRYGFIIGEKETPQGPRPILKKTWPLANGESVRSLANVGPAIAQLELPTGTYRLSVRLWSTPNKPVGESETIEITVADRPAHELSALISGSNLTVRGASDMKSGIKLQDLQKVDSRELRETLGLCSLLREMLTAQDISILPIGDYKEVVGRWVLPEIEEIESEILLGRDDKSQAKLRRDAILQRYPAMKYWADEAQRGRGIWWTIREMK